MTNKRQGKGSSQLNHPKDNGIEPIKLKDLNITESIYLGAILSASKLEYFPFISISNTEEQPIAPSLELLNEIVYSLAKSKILVLSDPLRTSFYVIEYLNETIDVTKISFYVNIEFMDKDEIIEMVLHPELDLKENSQLIIKLWKNINIEECKAYLHYSLKYVDFPNTVKDRAALIFEKYVDYFSVSQIIGVVNRCLGYTTIEYQAGKINKNNSGTYLLGTFINQADKAIEKKWDLYKFSRPKDFPESFLTSFFFKRVLKLKYSYYDIIPSISELV